MSPALSCQALSLPGSDHSNPRGLLSGLARYLQTNPLTACFLPVDKELLNFNTSICTLVLSRHLQRPQTFYLSNSSTLSLCLSPSLTLGSDFNGVGYGAIYSWQIKGRKILTWFYHLELQGSRLIVF